MVPTVIWTSAAIQTTLGAVSMQSPARPLNGTALASVTCGVASPLIFVFFVMIGALQEIGHSIFLESYRYEAAARVLMLILSVSAVVLGYRAKFQIAISNGGYRGEKLAALGRVLGYLWGAVMVFVIFHWLV